MVLFVLLLIGCHCPSPVGFCAHDLQYFLLGLPFLWPIRLRLQNFHWWRHKKCGHHPKGEACKSHDHVDKRGPGVVCIDPDASLCIANTNSSFRGQKENEAEMKDHWEKERSNL